MTSRGVYHLMLVSANLDRTVCFYTQVLGLQLGLGRSGMVMIRTPAITSSISADGWADPVPAVAELRHGQQ